MTVLEVIRRSADFLAKKGVDSPRLQIELLLAHVLDMPRLNLYMNFDRELTPAESDRVRSMVQRRGTRVPLQHITGSTSFCGLEIQVTPDVLIPRPETELLGIHAAQFLKTLPNRPNSPVSVLDMGSGSGCLAIYIAVQCPAAAVFAVDISAAALRVARQNAALHAVRDRIQFFQGDGFDALRPMAPFDLIVSNPPYIPTHEIATLAPEVREHDPHLALDGGEAGLMFYQTFAKRAAAYLRPQAPLMCEFGDGQEDAVREIFVAGGWRIVAVEQDLAGRPRIVIARRSES